MQKIVQEATLALKKLGTCFYESDSWKDRLILAKYSFNAPFSLLKRFFGKETKNNLSSPILIKNKFGLFYTGDRIYYAFAFTTQSDKKIREELKIKEGVFIDVGANGGMHTIPAALSLGQKGEVIAIEPEPKNFSILEKNVEINNLKNVICINTACFKEEKILKLFLDKEGQGGHSLMKDTPIKKEGFIEIKTQTLDNIIKIKKIKRVDLIKLDVEGAELDVLKGAKIILSKYKPKIIFEAWDEKYLNKISVFLSDFKYKIKRIDENNYIAN
jgi:FkbM family methyltransferase